MSIRVDGPLQAGSITIGDVGLGVLASAVPSGGEHGAGFAYDQISALGLSTQEIYARIITPPSAGTFTAFEDTSFELTAPDGDYSFTYQLYVDGVTTGPVQTVNVRVGAGVATLTVAGLTNSHVLAEPALTSASQITLQALSQGHTLGSTAALQPGQLTPDDLANVHVIQDVTIVITGKGVTITFYDGATLQVGLTDIRALWWDAANPSGAPAVEQTGLTTDASGVFEMALASSSLNVGQSGFLLVWLPDAVDDKDSLAFAGRLDVVNLN